MEHASFIFGSWVITAVEDEFGVNVHGEGAFVAKST
jgi:hypothetical protein